MEKTNTIQYLKVGVGGFILNKSNEILLLQRKKKPDAGSWSIPGGSVEYEETTSEAALREIKEEVNLDCKVSSLLSVTDHFDQNCHWVAVVYILDVVDLLSLNLNEPTKHSLVQWFSLSDLPENLTLPTKEAISQYLQRYKAR